MVLIVIVMSSLVASREHIAGSYHARQNRAKKEWGIGSHGVCGDRSPALSDGSEQRSGLGSQNPALFQPTSNESSPPWSVAVPRRESQLAVASKRAASERRSRVIMPKMLSAEEQAAGLAKVEGELLRILEDADVSSEVRALFGHFGIIKVRSFARLEPDETALRELLKKDFEFGDSIAERISMAHVLVAWDAAKDRVKRQAEAATEAKVHGTTPELPKAEGNSMRLAYEGVHGEIPDTLYPSNDYLKAKLDQVEDEIYEAEPMTEIVSRESAASDSSDVTLTLVPSALRVSKVKHRIAPPKDTEQLRARMKTMSMCWELVRMRYPDRKSLQGLTHQTFTNLVEYILGDMVWQFRGPADQQVTWQDVLAYEHEIRKRAMRWVRQQRYTVKEAIEAAIKDQEVRTTHFVTQLACSRSRKRDRSPLPEPRQPTPAQPKNNQGKGKGGQTKGGKGKGKGGKQDWSNQTSPEINAVNQAKKKEKLLSAVPNNGRFICIKYNKNTCVGQGCRFEHACLRCGEYGHRLGQCTKPKVMYK